MRTIPQSPYAKVPKGSYHEDMRQRAPYVFQVQPEALAEMLALRMAGWKERPLARLYKVDKTTIRYWVTKFDIKPKLPEIRATEEIRATVIISIEPIHRNEKEYKYQYLLDEEENVNPGKTYKQYVEAHKLRDPKFQFKKNPFAVSPDLL